MKDSQPTSRPKRKYHKKKKLGRKRVIRTFEETRVGHFLKYEAPLEYGLILEVNDIYPSADLIEQIGYSSLNPLFKKEKFRKALVEYRKTGLCAGKPRKGNVNTELYYIRLRKNQNVGQ